MNNRIQYLKTQALLWCDENVPEQFSEEIAGYGKIWEDKFAELIIKECGYAADVFESLGPPLDMDPIDAKPSDYIKKHLGVKE